MQAKNENNKRNQEKKTKCPQSKKIKRAAVHILVSYYIKHIAHIQQLYY
jgi:hypothetical protein